MPLVENAEPEDIRLPDWGGFKVQMMSDAAYQRVADRSKNRLAVNRLESLFTSQIENWDIACLLWGQMVAACIDELRPTAAEVDKWRAISNRTNMPIEFNDSGYPSPSGKGNNG